MKRKAQKYCLFFLILACLVAIGLHGKQLAAVTTAYPTRFQGETLLIDAGHGGEDGGAVSARGTIESQINLAIALRLDQLCGLYGIQAKLLRDSDISLHDSDCQTIREKKVSDLHNRVAMVEEENGIATLISIHQNSYPDVRYTGAQVFFAPTTGSEEFAGAMQEVLRGMLNPNNGRQAKRIPDTVYMMNHISCRAVLVECGFLTNPEEEKLLCSEVYQTKVAAALCGAYLQHGVSGKENVP